MSNICIFVYWKVWPEIIANTIRFWLHNVPPEIKWMYLWFRGKLTFYKIFIKNCLCYYLLLIHTHTHINISPTHVHTHIHICTLYLTLPIYIYIYIYIERERERESGEVGFFFSEKYQSRCLFIEITKQKQKKLFSLCRHLFLVFLDRNGAI